MLELVPRRLAVHHSPKHEVEHLALSLHHQPDDFGKPSQTSHELDLVPKSECYSSLAQMRVISVLV